MDNGTVASTCLSRRIVGNGAVLSVVGCRRICWRDLFCCRCNFDFALVVRAPPDPVGARKIILSPEEESLFKRYYAFFRFPFGTQNFAHFVNYARMFGVIWIAIGLWQRVYWMAAAMVVFYLISGSLMWRLSPIAHFKEGAERGHEFAVRGLARMEKILANRDVLGF